MFAQSGNDNRAKDSVFIESHGSVCRRLPTDRKGNSPRTPPLCGEISEFLSALVCVGLRLIIHSFS